MKAPTLHRAALLALLVSSLIALPASGQNCCAPAGNDVIAWWRLDETSGTAADVMGQHTGTHMGMPTPTPGMVQGALRLDGIDDYVSVPDSDDWTFADDFTIELWARWDVLPSVSDALVAHDQQPTADKWIFWVISDAGSPTGTGVISFHFASTSPATTDLLHAPFTPEVDRWYHLAVTRAGDDFLFYVDGLWVDTDSSSNAIPDSDQALTLGMAETGNYLDGVLDEVTVYGRALSASEIQSIHASGSEGKCGSADCNGNGVADDLDVCNGISSDLNGNEIPDECETVNYCTPATSASGCNALISATGIPSATVSSGFTLEATNVEGAKGGMFFYGTNGRQAFTWGTGFQCVVPPVKRGGLFPQPPGSTVGLCDGSFAQDLNARWCPACPKPAHNPGAGSIVQAQLWYRDPLNTSNKTTSLSDAIEFTVGP